MSMSNLFSVTSRIALITGGGSGIGSYIAHGLASSGASRVYIVGRREPSLATVTSAYPGIIIPIVGDVSTKEACIKIAEAFASKEKDAGVEKPSLDILVNNAGMLGKEGWWTPGAGVDEVQSALLHADDEMWMKEFAINASAIQVCISIVSYYLRLKLTDL